MARAPEALPGGGRAVRGRGWARSNVSEPWPALHGPPGARAGPMRAAGHHPGTRARLGSMPQQTFRGDPYRVLDVDPDATDATIKRRWRQLARDLHPDRAGGDATKTADLTKRMARVNAAYDLLRAAARRASYDAGHPNAGAGHSTAAREAGRRGASSERPRPGGPPPPPPTRPVTGRFDTSEQFHRRNATTTKGIPPLRGQLALSARERAEGPDPRRAR